MTIRIPLPRRIRFEYLLLGGMALFLSQMALGTDPPYALLVLLFVVVSGLTFNTLGGFATIGGVCIAMMALKIVIISQVAKVLFGQAADSNLEEPVITIAVMLLGLAAIYVAAILSRRWKSDSPILKPVAKPELLLALAIVTYALGTTAILYAQYFGSDPVSGDLNVGGLVGVVRQLAFIYPLSTISATAYILTSSRMKRSLGVLNMVPIVTEVALGILATGKQMMYEPFLHYLLTCIAFGYTFRAKHFLGIALVAAICSSVLYPIAQVGRSQTRSPDFVENIALTADFLKNAELEELRQVLEEESLREENQRFQYYGADMGLLDRFSLIKFADELIAATLSEGTSEWITVTHGLEMLLPRFIYPDKPVFNSANFLAHRVGILSDEDFSTQVSFGFIAEAFSAFEWLGVFIIPLVLNLLFFAVYKKLAWNVMYNVWAVFLAGYLQHAYVENTISAMLLLTIQFPLILVAVYFAARYTSGLIAAHGSRRRGPRQRTEPVYER